MSEEAVEIATEVQQTEETTPTNSEQPPPPSSTVEVKEGTTETTTETKVDEKTDEKVESDASTTSKASTITQPPPTAPVPLPKVDVLLNAVGNSPIMKTRKWAVDQEKQISWIIKFIHKYLKLSAEERIFLYVNQTFAPSPDQTVRNLYECYGANGKLNLYYCTSPAWG